MVCWPRRCASEESGVYEMNGSRPSGENIDGNLNGSGVEGRSFRSEKLL